MTLKDVAFDLHGFADGRVAVEELLRGVRTEDDDLAVVGEVGGLEVAALRRRRVCACRRREARWLCSGC